MIEQWPSAQYEDGCALHLTASCIARDLPSLERLFITWYEEDDLSAADVARALSPLAGVRGLRELHLLRSGENCGQCVEDPAIPIGHWLPGVAVFVRNGPPTQQLGTDQPMWELEDAADMLPEAGLCRGLAPRYDPHRQEAHQAHNDT